MLRLLETFPLEDVHAAVREALRFGAIGFDAIKHLILCSIQRRPPKLDLMLYPFCRGSLTRPPQRSPTWPC